MALSGDEGVGNGAQLPPSKCVKKPWFKTTVGHFSTLDWPRLL